MRIAEVAGFARVRVVRDVDFSDLALLGPEAARALVYAVDERAIAKLEKSRAAAVITTPALAERIAAPTGLATSDQPERDFYAIHRALHERTDFYWRDFATVIDPSAKVHERAYVAPRNVRIGARVTVEPNATVLERVTIGDEATIRAGTVLGAEGFEFKGPAMRQGRASRADRDYGARNERVPHAGSVEIGARVEIQALCAVDRSLFRVSTFIGDDTKVDNLVHVAHSVRIGRNCLITAGTVIAGSALIGDGVWIGPGSVISSGVRIDDGAAIVIGSTITRDVAAGTRVASDLKTYRLP
ncbi:MAG TPA: DapH/DapD/GlmU-related protein [Candidatus Limnocylindria bacterium]|jgi:UDP-3-O-[3-hydroxymyristoyl] glucosamine N-acyltransferase|nr:DapH/DapD/GlmU-related protein [Candidatus Limnocylindria bacterium]